MAWVLVMEDEPRVRLLAEDILKEAGHQTLCAGSSVEALALLRAYGLISVLFADIQLQEGDPTGLDLADQARAIRPNLKVLYTTGFDVTDKTRFVDGSAFIPKPYTPSQLTQAVAGLLSR